jgi:hypothetical protein
MSSPLASLLERFERTLIAQHAGVIERLCPGREPAEVKAALEDFGGGVAPAELVTWFSWHDGLAAVEYRYPLCMTLIGKWMPYSLSEALTYIREGPQWAGRLGLPIAGGSPAAIWLPLVHGPYAGAQQEHMLGAMWGDDERVIIIRTGWGSGQGRRVASSLTELVSAWLTIFEAGLRWDGTTDDWARQWRTDDLPPGASREWSRAGIW